VIRRRALPALLAASPALAQTREELPNMTPEVKAQLAPTGVLRAGINLSNFLLVTGKAANGDPTGVSPSMAATVAERLGVPVQYVTYPRPSELADAAGTGAWDIGLIGAEPQRAEKIAFTAAYCEIEATYLVPAGSPITSLAEVDRPGVRIATSAGAAYTLWLERNIKQELEYQSTLELDPRTVDRLRAIPVASEIIVHARQELVKRLDGYALEHAELFGRVAGFIEKKMMPIVLRHAISGTALVNAEDPALDDPVALAMLIDIFSERGYHAVVDLHRIEVPEHFDLKTGQIKCRVKKVYRIQVRFPGSEIRRG
jgi:ABC-type amino acid transport substrate-binding protein